MEKFEKGDRVQYGVKTGLSETDLRKRENRGTVVEIRGDMVLVEWDSDTAKCEAGVHVSSLTPLEE